MKNAFDTPYPTRHFQLMSDVMRYLHPKKVKHIPNFKMNDRHKTVIIHLLQYLQENGKGYLYKTENKNAGYEPPDQDIMTVIISLADLSSVTGIEIRTLRKCLYELSDGSFYYSAENQAKAQPPAAKLFSCEANFGDGETCAYTLNIKNILKLLGGSYKRGFHFNQQVIINNADELINSEVERLQSLIANCKYE